MGLAQDRKPPEQKPEPKATRKPLERKKGMRRVSPDPAKQKRRRTYDKMESIYFETNPDCDGGCGNDANQFHHICRGGNRARSLVNPNTGLGGCAECHAEWDHMTKAGQVAVKVRAIIRAVNRYLAPKDHPNPPQVVTVEEVKALL